MLNESIIRLSANVVLYQGHTSVVNTLHIPIVLAIYAVEKLIPIPSRYTLSRWLSLLNIVNRSRSFNSMRLNSGLIKIVAELVSVLHIHIHVYI